MYKILVLLIVMFAILFVWFDYTSKTVGFLYNPSTNAAEYLTYENKGVYFIASNIESDLEKFFRFLSNRGVRFVIGPSMSVDGNKVLPFLEKYNLISLSPTISSTRLLKSGYIYSFIPSNETIIAAFREYLKKTGCKNLLLVLDGSNREYSDDFKSLLDDFSGDFVYYTDSSSIRGISAENYDTAILTTMDKDSFEIVRLLKTANEKIRVVGTEASFSKVFLTLGGRFVEGTYFLVSKIFTSQGTELELIDNWVEFIQQHRFLSTQQFRRFINTHVLKIKDRYVYFTPSGVNTEMKVYVVEEGKFKEVQ